MDDDSIFADQEINNGLQEPGSCETFTYTFRGDGSMSAEDKVEWDIGFALGMDFTLTNYKKLRYTCPWPQDWGKGKRGDGFAEGCLTGRSVVIDRDYPGQKHIYNLTSGIHKVVFKDGRTLFVFAHESDESKFKSCKKQIEDDLRKVIKEMNRWPDIPVLYQLDGVCKMLKIKLSEGALNFCTGLLLGDAAGNIESSVNQLLELKIKNQI